MALLLKVWRNVVGTLYRSAPLMVLAGSLTSILGGNLTVSAVLLMVGMFFSFSAFAHYLMERGERPHIHYHYNEQEQKQETAQRPVTQATEIKALNELGQQISIRKINHWH